VGRGIEQRVCYIMIEKKTSMLVAQSQRAKGVASVAEASGARALGASVLLIVVAVYVASPCICAGTRGWGGQCT